MGCKICCTFIGTNQSMPLTAAESEGGRNSDNKTEIVINENEER